MAFPPFMDTYDPYSDPRVTPASKHAEPIASPGKGGKPGGGTDNMRANQSQKGPKDAPTAGSGSKHRTKGNGLTELDGFNVVNKRGPQTPVGPFETDGGEG